MPPIPATYRRGAVYYWRRWTPPPRRVLIQVSLGVKDQYTARRLASWLTTVSDQAFKAWAGGEMNRAELQAYLSKQLQHYRQQPDHAWPGEDWRSRARRHLGNGLAHLLLAKRGPGAGLRNRESVRIDDEWEDAIVIEALARLTGLRIEDAEPMNLVVRAAQAVEPYGRKPLAHELVQALAADHLAQAGAAFEAARRLGYDEPFLEKLIKECADAGMLPAVPEARLSAEEALNEAHRFIDERVHSKAMATAEATSDLNQVLDDDLTRPPNQVAEILAHTHLETSTFHESDYQAAQPLLDSIEMAAEHARTLTPIMPLSSETKLVFHKVPEHNSDTGQPAEPVVVRFQSAAVPAPREISIADFAREVTERNRADAIWNDHTANQALMTYLLFARMLEERHSITQFALVEQKHLAEYTALLRQLHKSHGKSARDKDRSLAEILEIAGRKPAAERGLSVATRNRHLTHLSELFRKARSDGLSASKDLTFSDLRVANRVRARDQRVIPSGESVQAFFSSPVFLGYKSPYGKGMHTPGDLFHHRAAFFAPLIAYYSGARREEYCGLTVEDVVDERVPFLHVVPNDIRGLKNPQSNRYLVLHPEVVRLGFLEYVKAIKALGYRQVFPDLVHPQIKVSLGERLYDELAPLRKLSGITQHQFRHFFNDELKQKRVSQEFRADMLGHKGDSETTERYSRMVSIPIQQEELLKIEIRTAHIPARPIKLLEWVERRQPPPWVRRVRRAG